ncbi:MAG: hypothetical protein P1P82_13125 [Bacteroidales bacterium]|nr:hypothetical protein [Bacteroidales bacterium]
MKKRYVLIAGMLLFAYVLMAQESLIGEWHLQELTMEDLDKQDVISGEQLKEDGTVWIMRFADDGSFYQKSNFNAASRMDEMEGTWKTEPGDKLTIFLLINGQKRPLQFFYGFKDGAMILERYDQLRSYRMVTVFRKKE